MTGDPMTDGMRHLAEALRAAASAVDLIADAVSGVVPDTGRAAPCTDHPVCEPVRTGSHTDAVPDVEAVVAALWPPVAVTLARDVEAKPNGRYRGRVRWRDPSARGGYRGHSHTFATESAAWSWVGTWTAPPVGLAQEAG